MKLDEVYGIGSDDDEMVEKEYRSSRFYRTLDDAGKQHPALSHGYKYQVWYMRPTSFRDLAMGISWLEEHEPEKIPRNIKDLPRTHVLLGNVSGKGLHSIEDLWVLMQGDHWSPNGEARDLIRKLNLKHTSMSVGDVVVVDEKDIYMVDRVGFKKTNPD